MKLRPASGRRLKERLLRALDRIEAVDGASGPDLARYRTDPVGYCRDVLHVTLTPDQTGVLTALTRPPYKVLVKSGHNVGKTFLAACAVNWWYDTRDPGVAITTAPTQRDVIDLLWTEVRLQRLRAGLPNHFIGPAAPHMQTSQEHYAKGYTASKGESFQGRHRPNMLFGFDEAEGIEPAYWTTTKSMFQPDGASGWLVILNPTTTESQAYLEEMALGPDGQPAWHLIEISALNHPNVLAGLRGEPPSIPNAVTLEQVNVWIADWCEPVPAGEQDATDIEWPPGSGVWHRPGPIGEARILGRRPSAGVFGVWSDALLKAAFAAYLDVPWNDHLPEIGCDVARYGDDWTSIHVRVGPCSLWHETHNGWSTTRTATRLKELTEEWAATASKHRPGGRAVRPPDVRVKVDDDGVGGGVSDAAGSMGVSVCPVLAGTPALRPTKYPSRRSELWFDVAGRARLGQLDLSRLPPSVLARIRVQAIAPAWEPDAAGRRKVEKKDDTKEKIGRSPDDVDALNLAYAEGGAVRVPTGVTAQSGRRADPGRPDAPSGPGGGRSPYRR